METTKEELIINLIEEKIAKADKQFSFWAVESPKVNHNENSLENKMAQESLHDKIMLKILLDDIQQLLEDNN